MKRPYLVIVCVLLVYSGWAASSIEVFEFSDPVIESRYRELIAELRCPKCLNTNLAGSDAPIAADLRKTVHRLLVAGKSNVEILKFLQERYGNFVLYDPPLIPSTWLLWFGPIVFVSLGGFVLYRFSRSSQKVVESAEEKQQVATLLKDVMEDENP